MTDDALQLREVSILGNPMTQGRYKGVMADIAEGEAGRRSTW